MEEVILTSKLPLNQLWLRVESLKEKCHWISITKDQLEFIGDPKRFVLPEDVSDFVHPMISNNSNFFLAVYTLLSLKVPLLPVRDNVLKVSLLCIFLNTSCKIFLTCNGILKALFENYRI